MDELAEGFAILVLGVAFGGVLILAAAAGVLLYLFCVHVLPPLMRGLGELAAEAESRMVAWWREVTWRRRMVRAHNEAIREIDAVRRENTAQLKQLVAELDRMELPTADRTTAVRSAVGLAVRSRQH